MIKYALRCSNGHEFEGWFRSSADFDLQQQHDELSCPVCGIASVEKAIMAPAIAKSSLKSGKSHHPTPERLTEVQSAMTEAANKAREYIEKNFDNVGKKFPEEARRIHYGETKARPVYGEATVKEAKELVEEGVSVAPVPGTSVPDDKKN